MTTSNDPEAIRRQIEQTQRELSYDVDALNEKVNPSRVMDRRVSAAKGRISRVRERVMGSAHDTRAAAQYRTQSAAGTVQDKTQGAAETVQGAAQQAAHAVQQAPDTIVRQAQGNPLAAGLIAFGVGWLVSSLLPASEKERQLAQQAESTVREHKDTLLQPAREAAQEIREELQPAAQQAVQEVKSTAQDAAQTVKQEGQSAAQDVQGQAQQSRQTVQSQTRS
ncbi:DUF3618 domain-containing protein [Geodermatophilus sp. URMC 61]|uniref:DUF3618 domain-containing protein n=1 Tax=Geodermatophilus sp. URMC 61 TaxID=3423411 RepID=UPI00406CD0FD